MPIALKDVNVEKANPAVVDAHGLGGPAINIFTLLFVPFSSRILAEALTWQRQGTSPWYYVFDELYTRLGYQLIGTTAVLPQAPNPFGGGNRPPWAR